MRCRKGVSKAKHLCTREGARHSKKMADRWGWGRHKSGVIDHRDVERGRMGRLNAENRPRGKHDLQDDYDNTS